MEQIRCLVLDVDGVLTDGRIFVFDDGSAGRAFHVQDGFAIRWFQKLGGQVALLSGKDSPAVAARARELKIEQVIQGSVDKRADLDRLAARCEVRCEQMAMIGDDLMDIPALRACGYPIAVANAVAEVKAAARYITTQRGGEGAVREAIEHLLRQDGRWQTVLAEYSAAAAPGENLSGRGAS